MVKVSTALWLILIQSEQNCLNIVDRFSQATGLVLQLEKFENKWGSKIHQVLEMLRNSTDFNQLFTLDALHCQKATVELMCRFYARFGLNLFRFLGFLSVTDAKSVPR